MKRLIITNDDGPESPGLLALVRALKHLGEIIIMTPDTDKSGESHRLTLNVPLKINKLASYSGCTSYSTDGTPADCVYLSISHLLKDSKIDLVVSGINFGFNLADDISYSGTVGAALEAVLLDVPAIAVSSQTFSERNLDNSTSIVQDLAKKIFSEPDLLSPGVFLNVNVPQEITDHRFKITTVGRRRYSKEVKQIIDPKGRTYYWIGGEALKHENIPGSDCNAIFDERVISITPINVAMTCYESFAKWKSIQL